MNNKIELLKRAIINVIPENLKNKFIYGTITEGEIKDILSIQLTDEQELGTSFLVQGESMIGNVRMNNVLELTEDVIKNNIQGDIIECGVWRGGTCIFMQSIIKELKSEKKLFVSDSFQGMPMPRPDVLDVLIVSADEVKANFEKYKLLDENIIFLEGWVKDTLPNIPSDQKFSLIRLDVDWYDGTMTALENLYPKLSEGGYIIIDDYAIGECLKAVNDYRAKHNIASSIITIDWTGVYWKK